MREGVCVLAEPADVVVVATGRGQQILPLVVLVLEHPPDEREAVRVHSGRGEADHGVSRFHPRAVDDAVTIDDPDAGSGEVELLLLVDARELGGLAPDESDAGLAADVGRALDELDDLLELDPARRDVIEEDERVGARRDHVVDAVRGDVGAARAQPSPLAGQDQLRPDRVGRRREEPFLVERMQAGEPPEPRCPGRLDSGSEPFDDGLPRGERDAGSCIGLAPAGHENRV
jgi:hypothetical protein